MSEDRLVRGQGSQDSAESAHALKVMQLASQQARQQSLGLEAVGLKLFPPYRPGFVLMCRLCPLLQDRSPVHGQTRPLGLSITDLLAGWLLVTGGPCRALDNGEPHPWPPPTRRQQCPLAQPSLVTTQTCLQPLTSTFQGSNTPLVETH